MRFAPSPLRARTYVLAAILVIVLGIAVYRVLWGSGFLPEGAARHVVLVVFDTLRADRMSLYGHSAQTSPQLEAASGELLRYGSTKATAPWTVPSHASMFTGMWPSEHRAQWGSFSLAESHLTLAEILRSRGFCTVGLSANPFVSESTGFGQGFDVFKNFDRVPSPAILGAAEGVFDRAAATGCDRVFLFINLMDTHIPYNFQPHAEAFGVSDPPIRDSGDKWAVSSGQRVLDHGEIGQHRAAYDAAVRATDDLASAVLTMLRERGILDQTLVVFTSDHGDGLGQHPEMGHVLSVWEEQLDVPLVVRLPGARRGGEVFEPRVSLLGLTPSVLDWTAVPRPPELEDRPTLEETAEAAVIADYRSYFAEEQRSFNQKMRERYPALAERASHRHVLYCGRDKLIVSPRGATQLFDLAADPTEQRDLADGGGSRWARCRAGYREQLRTGLFTPFDHVAPEQSLDREDIERLKSLGYLQ